MRRMGLLARRGAFAGCRTLENGDAEREPEPMRSAPRAR